MRAKGVQDPSAPSEDAADSIRCGFISSRFLLQSFNLLQMARPVRRHSFDQLGHGNVLLRLRMIGRLVEIPRLETLQQSQVRMAIQSVERDQFGGRSLQVAEVPRPVILVHGRNHRLLVREHLPQAVRVHNLDVGKMAENLHGYTTCPEPACSATPSPADLTQPRQSASDSSPPPQGIVFSSLSVIKAPAFASNL